MMPKRASWIGESSLICSEDGETDKFARGVFGCTDDFDRVVPKERQAVCETLLDVNLVHGVTWTL